MRSLKNLVIQSKTKGLIFLRNIAMGRFFVNKKLDLLLDEIPVNPQEKHEVKKEMKTDWR